ncbi:hypothetical protein MKX03_024920 [Papaver bracteatum]|nr:hypothetical protein MKX03_024920 [Papaver bracteatum]
MFNSAQQQSVFGQNNNLCAPKPFGSPTTPFGSQTGVSMFSGTSTGNFGGGTQAFSSPAFGNPVSSFGTPTFSPAFSTSIFGQKPASTFGVNPNTPTFGTPTTPALGTATTPGFGSQQTAPAFGIGLGGVFGVTSAASTTAPFGSQPNSGFGNNPFSSNPSPFGTQSSSFSFQTTTPSTFGTPVTFGQAVFGQQKRGGSRAVAYAPTELEDSALGTGKVKVHSIPFMHVYAEKSHEELRWDDYQLGDKGGLIPAATPQSNPFCTTQPNTLTTTPNPFSYGQKTTSFLSYTPGSTTSNLLFGTGSSLTSTAVFNQPSTPFTHNFGTTPSTTPAFTAPAFNFGTTPSTTPAFTAPTFNFGTTSSTTSASTPPFNFGTTPAFTAPTFNFGTTPSTTPAFTAPTFNFGTTPSTTPAFTAPTFNFGTTPSTTPAFTAPAFNFGTTPSTTPAFTAPTFNFGTTPAFTAPTFNFGTTSSTTSAFTPTFNFGTTPSTTPAFTAPTFNFGTTCSTTPSSTPPFNFGTTTSSTTSTATSPFSSTTGTTNTFGLTIGVPPKFQQTNNALGQFSSSVFAPVSTTSSCAPLTNTAGSQNTGFWNNSFNSTPGTTFGLTIGTPPAFQQTNNASWKFSSSAFAPVSTTSSCAPVTNTVGTQNSGFWNNSFNPTPGTTNTFGLTIGVPPTFQQANNALGQFSNSAPSQPSWSNTVTGQTNPSQQTQPAFSFPSSGQQQQLAFSFPNSGQQQQPAFSFPNSGQQQQPAVSSGGYNVSTGVGVVTSGVFNSIPPNSFGPFGQNAFPQMSTGNQSDPAATQPSVVAMNPFGTLPAMPQISIGHTRAAPSIQYGISKMPVVDKVAPVRVPSSLITSRHLSQRRIRLPARSSCPNDCARVPFFSDDVEAPSTPKADALSIPRENPRVFVLRPLEHWTSRTSSEQSKDTNNTPLHENENGHAKERTDIETLMPKLRYPEYYTEPWIQELAAKEREEPGFCGRVKDFTVGRHGFGSIKFAGETDVRNLDLESLVQFNNQEVIVYLDDSKKPPVGQGLNKAAVVTLLNIKCFDKKTGQQYLEGVKVEKYKELLMKKTVDQGAEFVSYDPIKGEWKFRVDHF